MSEKSYNMYSQVLLSFVIFQCYVSQASQDSLSKRDEVNVGVFSARNEELTLKCVSNTKLAYCWFRHPNGTHFTPTPEASDAGDSMLWFSGNLQTGECGIIFKTANDNETGMWECHMGGLNSGIEQTQFIDVKITGPLTAEAKEVKTNINEEVTLSCFTASGHRSLEYCRFYSPNGTGIYLDENSSKTNAVMNRYYFKEGATLNQGHCAITIISVVNEDFGEWFCAAKIEGLSQEAFDTLALIAVPDSTTSLASSVGIAIGVLLVVGVLAGGGFVTWYRRKRGALPVLSRGSVQEENIGMEDIRKTSSGSEGSAEVMFERPGPSVQTAQALETVPSVSRI